MNKRNPYMAVWLSTVALGLSTATGAVSAEAQQVQTYRFDIPSQSLGDAIRILGRATRQSIIFNGASVTGKRNIAIHGTYTAQEALTRMMGYSGLVVEAGQHGVFMVKPGKPVLVASASRAMQAPVMPVAPRQEARIAPAEQTPGEIIVTARKRAESVQDVPVILDVLTPDTLAKLRINDVYSLNSVVPSLVIIPGGAFTGITALIRGLGNGPGANYVDQTVALSLDGLTAPSGAFYRAGSFDMAQIEVLKGPQALFFGKSTSGGVISLTTADPTRDFDAGVTASYETVADETEVSGFVSAPITDDLGLRVAGLFSRSEGNLFNPNPTVSDRRVGGVENDGVRATLVYDADRGLRVRAKAFYVRNKLDGELTTISNTICPPGSGTPFQIAAAFDDCRLNRNVIGLPDLAPYRPGRYGPTDFTEFAAGLPSPIFRDGRPYAEAKIAGIPLQIDLDVADGLTLTSLSGYQWARFQTATPYAIATLLAVASDDTTREASQELRLTSDWKDSWINFMAGGLYSDARRTSQFVLVVPDAAFFTDDELTLKTRNASVFAQVQLKPAERLELSIGGRYTRVRRFLSRLKTFANFMPGPIDSVDVVSRPNRDRTERDFAPEITVSYRPMDDVILFGSYKQGYKAHSFNAVTTAIQFNDTTISPYRGERVEGFEGGVKGDLFDKQLTYSLAGYRYNYNDLQTSFVDIAAQSVLVSNDADARVQGFEATASLSPRSVRGLTLSGALNYTDSYYRTFIDAPCYASQTAAQGCSLSPRSGALTQDLSGQSLPFAAKWSGNVAADYQTAIGGGLIAGGNIRAAFTSDYQTSSERNPLGQQKGYTLFDAGLRVGPETEAWTVSLLCRNCTDKRYRGDTVDAGVVTDPNAPSPVLARVGRPRQVVLQLTVRPGRW